MDIIRQINKQMKLRSDSIIIRNPKGDAVKSVDMDLMLEEWAGSDYAPGGESRRVAGISIPLTPARYAETANIVDPATGKEITISVAGIAAAVEAITVGWIANPPQPEPIEDEEVKK